MAKVADWMRSNAAVYLDNASSRRDYRAQLRGNRAIILWTVYLLLLIGLGMLNYSASSSRGQVSVVDAQRTLQDFYQTVMAILGAMVILVAPALAATTIVVERERKSLDLVFSAPVKPKSLLVGKMISAYRYTWMLLVLSLPVTAVCVVLGGATWTEVLAAYALLSLHAMLYSAMALAISALSNKPVAALIWTYLSVGAYSLAAGGLTAAAAVPRFMGMSNDEAPFYVALSPLSVVQAAGTHTTIWGVAVPNWILFGIYALFLTRFLLLGAASALSPFNSWETKNLRITGLVSVAVLGYGLAYIVLATTHPSSFSSGGSTTSGKEIDLFCAALIAVLPMLLLVPLPFLTCSGPDGERKFWPNGIFSFKEAIRGTPAGALPYLLMTLAGVTLAVLLACVTALHDTPGLITVGTVVWSLGFWIFCWSLGRLTSVIATELKAARTLHLASLIVLFGLPVPFLFIIDPEQQTPLWSIYPLWPLFSGEQDSSYPRFVMGLALAAIGAIIAYSAEKRRRIKAAVPPVMA